MGEPGKIYVGNLSMDVRERDIEDAFRKFGKIRRVDIKRPSNPPAYCFVEYDDVRDAEDATYEMNRTKFDGDTIRVEFSRAKRDFGRSRGRSRSRSRGRGGGGYRGRPHQGFRRGPNPTNRVKFTGLPRGLSWQDLKDEIRKEVGDVTYADVDREGTGVAEFGHSGDVKRCIKKMDDISLDGNYIRVKRDDTFNSKSRSRSRSPRRSRSRDRRRKVSRSRSRSRKRSQSRERRKMSRSRSRSPKRSRSRDRKKMSRSRSRSPRRSRSRSRRGSRSRSASKKKIPIQKSKR